MLCAGDEVRSDAQKDRNQPGTMGNLGVILDGFCSKMLTISFYERDEWGPDLKEMRIINAENCFRPVEDNERGAMFKIFSSERFGSVFSLA
jgi:hypothetical protein